jgi:hypothetical protein
MRDLYLFLFVPCAESFLFCKVPRQALFSRVDLVLRGATCAFVFTFLLYNREPSASSQIGKMPCLDLNECAGSGTMLLNADDALKKFVVSTFRSGGLD